MKGLEEEGAVGSEVESEFFADEVEGSAEDLLSVARNTRESVLVSHFKGALSRGFRRFLVLTVLKLVVGNLTRENHYL